VKIIIEGIDRLGKDTLQSGIINTFGYHHVIHYSSPKNTNFYKNDDGFDEQFWFQHDSFLNGFDLLEKDGKFIYNRFHLGEFVYSQRYRNYDGSYVFGIEKMFRRACQNVKLILLCTSNFDMMEDDGKSHDFSKRELEQADFYKAFEMSHVEHKYKVDVAASDGSGYRSRESILDEVVTKLKNGD